MNALCLKYRHFLILTYETRSTEVSGRVGGKNLSDEMVVVRCNFWGKPPPTLGGFYPTKSIVF